MGKVKKIKQVALECLQAGLSTQKVAIAIATGIIIGIFPIYGPFSLVCLFFIWLGRLNGPIVFAGYYGMNFVKPLLILPYLKLGEWIFQAEPMTISLTELSRRFTGDAWGTLSEFGWSFLHATVGWLVSVPFLLLVLYGGGLKIIRRWRKQDVVKAEV